MNSKTVLQYTTHLMLGMGVSGLLLALLVHASLSSADIALLPGVVGAVTSVAGGYLLLYIAAIAFRTVMQALRYRLILQTSEPETPRFFHLLLVTTSRNMFVDMLPARLGELSYVAMLNRGYRVGMPSCLSSLAISFAFDLGALGIIIAGVVLQQLLSHGVQPWVLGTLLIIGVVFCLLLFLLFPGLQALKRLLEKLARTLPGSGGKVAGRLIGFLGNMVIVMEKARKAGIIGRLVLLSLGVRAGKYLGYYALFYGVAAAQFPQVDTQLGNALIALISAEAGASMPLPSFMGFGSYEAAGMLAMIALGADRAASLLIMLSLHVLSQIMDYGLGGCALIAFLISTRTAVEQERAVRRFRISWYSVAAVLFFFAGGLFAVNEFRSLRKVGALKPPESGQAVQAGAALVKDAGQTLKDLHGFVVWSSNRSGNHDLWMLALPGMELKQLTTNPHTEYYPRISPDGTQVVFARSKQPWVSQRNNLLWDVILLDLRTGRERELAKDGNVPTWSADGRSVFFQRSGNQLVRLDVASGREAVVWQTGKNLNLPASVLLETPVVAPHGGAVAVTLRGSMRATAVIEPDGQVKQTGDGCQITWAPDGSYLLKVDHGGKQQNAFYRIDPATLKAQQWFDFPGEFSHEYFPKISNTGNVLVYGASTGGHEHDTADYEIFLWRIGRPANEAVRLTYHTGNDCWPDIYLVDQKH